MKSLMTLLLAFLLAGCRTIGTIPLNSMGRLPSIPDTATSSGPTSSYSSSENRPAKYNQGPPKDYDPFPDIDGYSHASHPEEILSMAYDRDGLIAFSKNVIIVREAPIQCNLEDFLTSYFKYTNDDDRDNFLKLMASEYYSNTVHLVNSEVKNKKVFVKAYFYNCPNKQQRKNKTLNFIQSKDTHEIDILMGSYVDRTGFLKLLGKTGPTVGFTYHHFSKDYSSPVKGAGLGWYFHFNFDHFFETDSTLLDAKFIDEEFTNYLWSFGASARYIFNEYIQLNYDIGPAINFLEIDTNRTNSDLSDDEATRTTFSLVHQLAFNFRVQNNFKHSNYKKSDKLLGLNFLYYWMPDALGEFAANNSEFESYEGGSFAIMLSLKIQGY